jgi:hypothetical protein
MGEEAGKWRKEERTGRRRRRREINKAAQNPPT